MSPIFFVRFLYVCCFEFISLSAQITMLTSFNVFIAHEEFWPKKNETTKLPKLRHRPTMMLKITKNQPQKPFFWPSFKKYRSSRKKLKKNMVVCNVILNRFVKIKKIETHFLSKEKSRTLFTNSWLKN